GARCAVPAARSSSRWVRPPTLPPVCKGWRRRIRSSSVPRPSGWYRATLLATRSVPTRSRAWRHRSRSIASWGRVRRRVAWTWRAPPASRRSSAVARKWHCSWSAGRTARTGRGEARARAGGPAFAKNPPGGVVGGWAARQDGAGQVVLLRGEAGIGKSRLVEVLRERVRSEGATPMVWHCAPEHQQSVLYPVIDHLQRFLQWQRHEPPEAKCATLER